MPVSPREEHENNSLDVTGWLLEDARATLNAHELTLIETTPPRASGPLGDWHVLRCRYAIETETGKTRCELLIAREQLPKIETPDS